MNKEYLKSIRRVGLKLLALGSFLAMLSPSMMVTSCLEGTEVENEVVQGRVINKDGSPAVGAVVSLVQVDYLPDVKANSKKALLKVTEKTNPNIKYTMTNSKGRYSVKPENEGRYNLLANLDGAKAMDDSVVLNKNVSEFADLKLADPGGVTGRVRVQKNHDVRAVIVQVLGTEVYTNVNDEGYFTLDGFAAGKYRLRITHSTTPGYVPLFTNVIVRSGRVDTLDKEAELIYSEIPIVTGIKVSFDTATLSVKLQWDSTNFSGLRRYVITRSLADENILLNNTQNYSDSPSWTQKICDSVTSESCIDKGNWEFRISIEDKSGTAGLTWEYASLDVASLNELMPEISFTSLEQNFIVGEAISMNAKWKAGLLAIEKLQFVNISSQQVLENLTISTQAKNLSFISNVPEQLRLGLVYTLKGGFKDTLEYGFTSNPSNGRALIASDTSWLAGDTVGLCGSCMAPGPEYVKWEWDLGDGKYVESDRGYKTYTMTAIGTGVQVLKGRALKNSGEEKVYAISLKSEGLKKWKLGFGNDFRFFNNLNDTVVCVGVSSGTSMGRLTKVYPSGKTWTINFSQDSQKITNDMSLLVMDNKIILKQGGKLITGWDPIASKFQYFIEPEKLPNVGSINNGYNDYSVQFLLGNNLLLFSNTIAPNYFVNLNNKHVDILGFRDELPVDRIIWADTINERIYLIGDYTYPDSNGVYDNKSYLFELTLNERKWEKLFALPLNQIYATIRGDKLLKTGHTLFYLDEQIEAKLDFDKLEWKMYEENNNDTASQALYHFQIFPTKLGIVRVGKRLADNLVQLDIFQEEKNIWKTVSILPRSIGDVSHVTFINSNIQLFAKSDEWFCYDIPYTP